MPDIRSAQYQFDGLVRVYLVDETETVTDESASSPMSRQLLAWVDAGNAILPYAEPEPRDQDVDAERDRRLRLGFMITLDDGHMVALQTATPADWRNIAYLATVAGDYKQQGGGQGSFTIRDAYNLYVTLTYTEMVELQAKLSGASSEIYQASWALKDQSHIPSDFKDDKYWPQWAYPPEPPPGYPT